MSNYDLWLLNEADRHMQDCEPKVVQSGWEYEGGGEYSRWFIMNCEGCTEKDCEHWSEYNETI